MNRACPGLATGSSFSHLRKQNKLSECSVQKSKATFRLTFQVTFKKTFCKTFACTFCMMSCVTFRKTCRRMVLCQHSATAANKEQSKHTFLPSSSSFSFDANFAFLFSSLLVALLGHFLVAWCRMEAIQCRMLALLHPRTCVFFVCALEAHAQKHAQSQAGVQNSHYKPFR